MFEVLLALAIFVGSLAVLSQMLATGVRGALRGKLETEAVFRAESKLAEVTVGAAAFQTTTVSDPDAPNWSWNVSVLPGPSDQLFIVEVTAAHAGPTPSSTVSFTLSKLVRDPQLLLDAASASAESETDE